MNTLRQAVHEYLSMRRSLGFKLREAGKALLDFVTFMEQHRAIYITEALALSWAKQPENVQAVYWARRLSFVRGFARFRSSSDPRTQIPSPGLLPFQPQRARPYLYTDKEIESLLSAARDMPHRYQSGALLPWVYYCLFGLLSVSGLRLSEARNLKLQDVDLDNAVLTVRGAKFGKTRLVPLHTSTCKVLADYMNRRKRHWAERTVSPYLFVSSWGNRLDDGQIHRAFYVLSRQIGLRGATDSHGPRLHDLSYPNLNKIQTFFQND
jgi:integrase